MPFLIERREDPQYPLFLVKDEADIGWTARKREASLFASYEAETIAEELNRHASIVAVEVVGVRNTVESVQ